MDPLVVLNIVMVNVGMTTLDSVDMWARIRLVSKEAARVLSHLPPMSPPSPVVCGLFNDAVSAGNVGAVKFLLAQSPDGQLPIQARHCAAMPLAELPKRMAINELVLLANASAKYDALLNNSEIMRAAQERTYWGVVTAMLEREPPAQVLSIVLSEALMQHACDPRAYRVAERIIKTREDCRMPHTKFLIRERLIEAGPQWLREQVETKARRHGLSEHAALAAAIRLVFKNDTSVKDAVLAHAHLYVPKYGPLNADLNATIEGIAHLLRARVS